jgi:hypothetical protein
LQYLKSYNYLPAECEQMRVICDGVTAHRRWSHQSGVFEWAGGVGAEVFRDAGEAE